MLAFKEPNTTINTQHSCATHKDFHTHTERETVPACSQEEPSCCIPSTSCIPCRIILHTAMTCHYHTFRLDDDKATSMQWLHHQQPSKISAERTHWLAHQWKACLSAHAHNFNGLYSFGQNNPWPGFTTEFLYILYLIQPISTIQNYQLTNILAMWLSKTSAKAIFFGAS